MIKLYLMKYGEKSISKKIIGSYKTPQECNQAINDYIIDNKLYNVKPYRRYWQEGEETMIDYGSHWNFFTMKPTCQKSANELLKWVCGDE